MGMFCLLSTKCPLQGRIFLPASSISTSSHTTHSCSQALICLAANSSSLLRHCISKLRHSLKAHILTGLTAKTSEKCLKNVLQSFVTLLAMYFK